MRRRPAKAAILLSTGATTQKNGGRSRRFRFSRTRRFRFSRTVDQGVGGVVELALFESVPVVPDVVVPVPVFWPLVVEPVAVPLVVASVAVPAVPDMSVPVVLPVPDMSADVPAVPVASVAGAGAAGIVVSAAGAAVVSVAVVADWSAAGSFLWQAVSRRTVAATARIFFMSMSRLREEAARPRGKQSQTLWQRGVKRA